MYVYCEAWGMAEGQCLGSLRHWLRGLCGCGRTWDAHGWHSMAHVSSGLHLKWDGCGIPFGLQQARTDAAATLFYITPILGATCPPPVTV